MNKEQYDVLHRAILSNEAVIKLQNERILSLENKLTDTLTLLGEFFVKLDDKTVVISDVDEQFTKLNLEIQSLKDEQEA